MLLKNHSRNLCVLLLIHLLLGNQLDHHQTNHNQSFLLLQNYILLLHLMDLLVMLLKNHSRNRYGLLLMLLLGNHRTNHSQSFLLLLLTWFLQLKDLLGMLLQNHQRNLYGLLLRILEENQHHHQTNHSQSFLLLLQQILLNLMVL